MNRVIIHFETEKQADDFMNYFYDHGEQDYRDTCDIYGLGSCSNFEYKFKEKVIIGKNFKEV